MSISALAAAPECSPTDPGELTRYWDDALGDAPAFAPPLGPMVVVAPHPDDETLGAGGLIARYLRAGQIVTVVVATDGEGATLGDTRRSELLEALRALGPGSVRVIFLGLPGGTLEESQRDIESQLATLLSPTDLLVVPWEHDGHPDHEAVGRAGIAAANRTRASIVRYPVFGWHHGDAATFESAQAHVLWLSEDEAEGKSDAIGCYRSRLAPPHLRVHFEQAREVFFVR